jgi:TIR domain
MMPGVRVGLFADDTLDIDLAALTQLLSQACHATKFTRCRARFDLSGGYIKHPVSYGQLGRAALDESERFELSIFATATAYQNNYFFQSYGSRTIVSFHDWRSLTDLPVENGFAYMVAAMIVRSFEIGEVHGANTGCVNDFWWEKTGVDRGMRAGYVCGDCIRTVRPASVEADVLADVRAILNLVAHASGQGGSILGRANAASDRPGGESSGFDVFLCHNSVDKPAVRAVNDDLRAIGLTAWLDEEELPPGLPWQDELERVIADVRSALVFIGPNGLGPWQQPEMRAFLSEFVSRRCPVVPALLPGAPDSPDLPIFLRQMTWLDLRGERERAYQRLTDLLRSRR